MMTCNPFDKDILLLATTSNVDVTKPMKFDLCHCGSSTIIKIILVITFRGAALLQHNAPETYGIASYRHFVDDKQTTYHVLANHPSS